MLTGFRLFLCWVLRTILSLRYSVRLQGLEAVQRLVEEHPGKTLVLPNHPALVDPMIVFSQLWPVVRMRPLVWEGNFKGIIMSLVGRLINALEVPDMAQASMNARNQAEDSVAKVIDGLKAGENFILWPSGRLRRGPQEVLGGARALSDILRKVPGLNLVLIRTRGLGGSRFSYAYEADSPKLFANLFAGAASVVASLLFFLPRRSVELTLEVLTLDDPKGQTPWGPQEQIRREVVNPWFEKWYNAKGPETPLFVPYHALFGRKSYEFPKMEGIGEIDLGQVKPETKMAVLEILTKKLQRPLTDIDLRAETTLDELGMDSLDRMDLNLLVERRFGFSSDQVPANIGEIWALAQGLLDKGTVKVAPPQWFHPLSESGEATILGNSFAEAFVNRALKNRGDVVLYDDLAGVLTFERVLVGALTMSRRLAKLPRPHVGLLLPASAASDIAFMALHLARKLPVLLNWTTGPANLEHAASIMELQHVVTSRAFIDRTGIVVKGTEFIFLEDLRAKIKNSELLRTLIRVRHFPRTIRKKIPKIDPDTPGVVLFTSGSEKAPKAVPLTHNNVLSNQKYGIPFLGLLRQDIILGFLPAFHSFGMSVTGLLPLLTGIRVARHPDPTDAGGLVRKIESFKTTLLVGTPTFVSYILERARPGQLDSLRLIIVGAEKCPQALFERCKERAPHAELLEGYGITECSPVVSVNPPGANRPGTIGKPLPRVELCVMDLETDRPLGCNELGMLHVSGPTIFPGYLGYDGPSPFREINGKRWYITGDLARIDADGYLHFSGRLKRFLKIGGEMVSLPALEEPLSCLYPPTDKGPQLAVEGIEGEGKRKIVLFTTDANLTLSRANEILEESGFHGIMRLDEVRHVQSIPVLGTGKTDYKVLKALIFHN